MQNHEYLAEVNKDLTKKEKLDICRSCPNMTALYTCKICNCFMPAKIYVSGDCPEGKFGR